MKSKYVSLALLLALALNACGGDASQDSSDGGATPRATTSSGPTTSPSPAGTVHRVTVRHVCANSDALACPARRDMPRPLELRVRVPAGWQPLQDFPNVIAPQLDSPTEGPDGAALVMGWTTFQLGLNSDPCLTPAEVERHPDGHEPPDVRVGPAVDDFVDAVRAQKAFDVSRPVDAKVGGHPARFFSLEGPDDLSGCELWRPWDPGIYVQGESNHWDVWVVDVDGQRVVFLAQHFPGTPPQLVDELEDMVESLRFRP